MNLKVGERFRENVGGHLVTYEVVEARSGGRVLVRVVRVLASVVDASVVDVAERKTK